MNITSSKSNTSRTIHILVVEDERIIALNLKESLELLGYVVPALAQSGEQAIEKATEFRPNLVLMDIRLKGNIDGIEAAQQIWENLQIPVIYVTGHSDRSTLERAKVTAPFGYILKPIKERELYVSIETALQRYEREQLLSAILKGMGDGVIVVNAQNRVEFLNPMAESLTGWRHNEARDRELTEVFQLINEQTRQPLDNPVTTALQQESTVYLEDSILLISKDGKVVPIGDSVAPIKDNQGAIAGAVLVFRDITQYRLAQQRNLAMERARQLELQIAETQRLNQLKDEFMNLVSHELRTPLSNIKTAVQLLESALEQQSLLGSNTVSNAQSMARYLNILQQQCNQELALVNSLLDMQTIDANANPLDLSAIDLQHWIPHIVEMFQVRAQTQQQNLQVNLSCELPLLVSELPSLSRILSELLNNACKYTPAGEQILVTAEGDASSSNPVQIRVSNSGVEIPQAELSRIFNPFYRIPTLDIWQQGGSGLGLALVKKLVNRLQGTIEARNTQGWLAFTIEIPNLELPL